MSDSLTSIQHERRDAREIPHPPHPWEVAKRCIQKTCVADEHEWVKLTGLPKTAYWRECPVCGMTDVTAQTVGQDVETLETMDRGREESL